MRILAKTVRTSSLALSLLLAAGTGFASVDATAQFPDQVLPVDPFKAELPSRPGDRDFELRLRVIDHGSKYDRKDLARFVQATELIYSQCEGVRLHVAIDEVVKADKLAIKVGYVNTIDRIMTLNEQWFEAHLPWMETRKRDVADVHLIDHFSESNRQAFKSGGKGQEAYQKCRVSKADALILECKNKHRMAGNPEKVAKAAQACVDPLLEAKLQECEKMSQFDLGQAFDASFVEDIYRDSRGEGATPRLSEVAGYSVTLAMKTHEAYEGRIIRQRDPSLPPKVVAPGTKVNVLKPIEIDPREYVRAGIVRNSSLLAHELGHIVFENKDEADYRDHYCPGLGKDCPKDHVMSSGGSGEMEILGAPKFKKVVGYSALPKIDPMQCARMLNHPLVRIGKR